MRWIALTAAALAGCGGSGDGGGDGSRPLDGAVADLAGGGGDAATPPGNGPAVLFVDAESGPNQGGPSGQGVPIAIFGRGFGATQGASTVTIGGVAVAAYLEWGAANAQNPMLDRIVVQPGAKVQGGPIVVTVSGQASNGEVGFTVRPGAIFAVAPGGSDGADCSLAAPCASISHVASGIMQPGDTLLVHGGIYAGDSIWIRADHGESGAAGMPKLIARWPGEQPEETALSDNFLVDADYVTVSGLSFPDGGSLDLVGWASARQHGDRLIDNAFRGTTSYDAIGTQGDGHDILGNDCELAGSSVDTEGHCYYLEQGSDLRIGWNVARGEGGYGLHLHEEVRMVPDMARVLSNVRVEGNLLYASPQRSGMVIEFDACDGQNNCYDNYAEGITIVNNLFVGNNHAGLVVEGAARDVKVYDNTFYQNGRTALSIGGANAAQILGVEVRGNLFYQSDASTACMNNCDWFPPAHLQIDAAAQMVTVDTNWYGPGAATFTDGSQAALASPDPHPASGMVSLADPTKLDFHLGAGACVDQGVALPEVPRDFDGHARPSGAACDLGAFERVQ